MSKFRQGSRWLRQSPALSREATAIAKHRAPDESLAVGTYHRVVEEVDAGGLYPDRCYVVSAHAARDCEEPDAKPDGKD